MRLGIMQPYFFPYLGYFDLIHQTDRWVVFDTAQYIRHGWINRNRILHPSQGWLYIIAPVKKHRRSTPICDIRLVNDSGKWQNRLVGQLQHYKKEAPYFQETIRLLEDCLANRSSSLSRLNIDCIARTCDMLGIDFNYDVFSEINLQLGHIAGPGDWALRISEALGATEYVNPPGGSELFDREKFRRAQIKLTIREIPSFQYDCGNYDFIPDLSIIDVLMWNKPATIRRYLERKS